MPPPPTAKDQSVLYVSNIAATTTGTARLTALDTTTRQKRWWFEAPGYFGPDVHTTISADGSTAYVAVQRDLATCRGQKRVIYAVDTATGKEKWNLPTTADQFTASPILSGDGRMVYVATSATLFAIDATQ